MTILDFFFKQTPKQIKECFKNVGLDKYYDVPSNNEEFWKFGEVFRSRRR